MCAAPMRRASTSIAGSYCMAGSECMVTRWQYTGFVALQGSHDVQGHVTDYTYAYMASKARKATQTMHFVTTAACSKCQMAAVQTGLLSGSAALTAADYITICAHLVMERSHLFRCQVMLHNGVRLEDGDAPVWPDARDHALLGLALLTAHSSPCHTDGYQRGGPVMLNSQQMNALCHVNQPEGCNRACCTHRDAKQAGTCAAHSPGLASMHTFTYALATNCLLTAILCPPEVCSQVEVLLTRPAPGPLTE